MEILYLLLKKQIKVLYLINYILQGSIFINYKIKTIYILIDMDPNKLSKNEKKILDNEDIFGRGNKLQKIDIDNSYPTYITKNNMWNVSKQCEKII